MKQHDIEAFGGVLGAVMSMYDKEPSDEVALVWFNALKQFPIEDVSLALTRHLQDPDQGRFAPKPADVIAHLSGGAATRSLVAWSKVEKATGSIGSMRSVCFDDPIINKVIDDMGGWARLCATATDELKFRAIDFQKRYTGLMQTGGAGADYPAYLPGTAEAHNRIAGYEVSPPVLIGDQTKALAVLEGASAVKLITSDAVKALTHKKG